MDQLTYTAQLGNGVSATISLEDQTAYYTTNIWNTAGATAAGIVTGVYGANSIGGTRAPDIIGKIGVDQAWGVFQVMAAAHNNQPSYYGATETTGHPDDKWGCAVQGVLQIKNLPTGAGDDIKLQAVYTDGASRYNFHSLATTSFAMYGGAGLAGAYQSLGIAGVADAVYGPGGQLRRLRHGACVALSTTTGIPTGAALFTVLMPRRSTVRRVRLSCAPISRRCWWRDLLVTRTSTSHRSVWSLAGPRSGA